MLSSPLSTTQVWVIVMVLGPLFCVLLVFGLTNSGGARSSSTRTKAREAVTEPPYTFEDAELYRSFWEIDEQRQIRSRVHRAEWGPPPADALHTKCQEKVDKTSGTPQRRAWCEYDLDQWEDDGAPYTSSGKGRVVTRASTPSSDYVRTQVSERFRILFKKDEQTWTYRTTDGAEFLRLTSAGSWRLKIDARGQVMEVLPSTAEAEP